jgi:hypothetical protein
MTKAVAALPAFAEFVLTRRIPCATLAVAMFTALLWLPAIGSFLPPLVPLVSAIALFIHLLTPGLFALVFFGGGFSFAWQTGLLAAVATSLVNLGLLPGLAMFVLYVVFPVAAAYLLLLPTKGLERSLYNLAVGLGIIILLTLMLGAGHENLSMLEYSNQLLAPFFDPLAKQVPAGVDPKVFQEALAQIRQTSAQVFPGSVTLSAWLVWMGNLLLARRLASRYGFYGGTEQPLASIRFSKRDAIVYVLLMAAVSMLGGTLQYLALNAGIVLSGLFAIQGLAVAHVWLSRRRLKMLSLLLYPMLLMQPVMILPFLVIGLFDVWFDYRGRNTPASGGM